MKIGESFTPETMLTAAQTLLDCAQEQNNRDEQEPPTRPASSLCAQAFNPGVLVSDLHSSPWNGGRPGYKR